MLYLVADEMAITYISEWMCSYMLCHLTCEDDVGDIVVSIPSTVILVLIVKELLVSTVLQFQGTLCVGREWVLIRAATGQTTVVQREAIALGVCGEL